MADRAIPELGPDDHVAGPDDAPLELVMYGDFQCPYCAAAQSIVRRVRERLDGRLRFAFRHFPIRERHPDAQNAAEVAESAAAQGAFWEMHDRLYTARGKLSESDLRSHVSALGLDTARVADELARHEHAPRVQRDLDDGMAAGVTGTPAFFVNGHLHGTAFDASSLVEALKCSSS